VIELADLSPAWCFGLPLLLASPHSSSAVHDS
jgi:hypothetical protein